MTPRPGTVDPRGVGWESAEAQGDQVTVVWWSGVEPCYVLDRVEVAETRRTVTITIFEGSDLQAGDDAVCIEIAQTKAVRVQLDQPLGGRRLVNGAR